MIMSVKYKDINHLSRNFERKKKKNFKRLI